MTSCDTWRSKNEILNIKPLISILIFSWILYAYNFEYNLYYWFLDWESLVQRDFRLIYCYANLCFVQFLLVTNFIPEKSSGLSFWIVYLNFASMSVFAWFKRNYLCQSKFSYTSYIFLKTSNHHRVSKWAEWLWLMDCWWCLKQQMSQLMSWYNQWSNKLTHLLTSVVCLVFRRFDAIMTRHIKTDKFYIFNHLSPSWFPKALF